MSIDPADATDHFGFIGAFFALDMIGDSDATQELLDRNPTGPSLVEDLASGASFRD